MTMRSYSLLAPAKVNLYLEILGDRPDGFHELAMILQSIRLADEIQLYASGTDQIRLHCDHPDLPVDESNLAYRAAALMRDEFADAFARYGGVDISIQKRIPIGAGLAGGSTDAAAVLVGIDLLWKLGLTQSELQELGAKLGSDVPFCITGGTAIATGRGEQLDPLTSLDGFPLVLAKYRSLSVSTAWAYTTYRQQFCQHYLSDRADFEARRQAVHSGAIVHAISHHNAAEIGQHLHNDLEKIVLPAHASVARLRQAFEAWHPLGVMMSGSGPTVFALAQSQTHAEQMKQGILAALSDPDLEVWVTEFVSHGIQLSH